MKITVFINSNCINSSEDENEIEEVQQDSTEEEEEVPDPKLGKVIKLSHILSKNVSKKIIIF